MIYEEIQNTFLSLANQWRDLAESFLRLASLETAGSPRDRALQGGSTEREGLAFRCDHETIGGLNPADQGGNCQESEGLALFFVPQPNVDLGDVIDDAINRLQDQETLRQGIEADFTSSSFSGTLGPPPLSTFTNVAMFPLPGSGAPPERVEILDCRQTLQDFRQFIAGNIQRLQEITSPETTTPASLSSIRNTVDDIASYPMLTSEMGSLPPLYCALCTGHGRWRKQLHTAYSGDCCTRRTWTLAPRKGYSLIYACIGTGIPGDRSPGTHGGHLGPA